MASTFPRHSRTLQHLDQVLATVCSDGQGFQWALEMAACHWCLQKSCPGDAPHLGGCYLCSCGREMLTAAHKDAKLHLALALQDLKSQDGGLGALEIGRNDTSVVLLL